MVLLWTLLIIGAIVAFHIGKLPQYFCLLMGLLIAIKIVVIAMLFFFLGLLLFRPHHCCRRC